jgi:hypothetical protein
MNISGQKRGGTQRDEEYNIITIDIADEGVCIAFVCVNRCKCSAHVIIMLENS